MYREPRSLGLAQRIVTWTWGACCSVTRPRVDTVAESLQVVSLTARGLEISEFELFARAYRSWYGHAPVVRDLEREFGRFLNLRCNLPFYVRRFVARIDTLAA
ncbi:MAG: hypothetical protein OET44_13580 [Gammaproteobacteria bacterium]|nr:hypothetical protein [Gammaproteobacteria bacterium]